MKKQKQKLLILFGSVLLISGMSPVYGESRKWLDGASLEGFVSQTFSHSSDYNFLSESDDRLSADLWEAGLLGSAKVIHDLQFSGQLLARQVSKDRGTDARVDYAFFSLPLAKRANSQIGARLGRIRSSFGFENETRDIPHTRVGILMPQSIYYDMTRNSFYSSDGIELFADRTVFDKRLSFQLFFSRPVADSNETPEYAGLLASNLKGERSILFRASYGSDLEGFRYALTYYKPEYSADLMASYKAPSPLPSIKFSEAGANFYSQTLLTSIEYNALRWAITLEYSRHKFKADLSNWSSVRDDLSSVVALLPSSGLSAEQQQEVAGNVSAVTMNLDRLTSGFYEESYYLRGLYRLNDQWDGYVRYDASRMRGRSRSNLLARWVDLNIGSTYRPDEHWLLRAELHYIDGRSRLLADDNVGRMGSPRYWTAAFFQVAYRF